MTLSAQLQKCFVSLGVEGKSLRQQRDGRAARCWQSWGHPAPSCLRGVPVRAHPYISFPNDIKMLPHCFSPLTPKNQGETLGFRHGADPRGIPRQRTAIPLPSGPRAPCQSQHHPLQTPASARGGKEGKNHLFHGGICIDGRRWKVLGSISTRCSPAVVGRAGFKR